MSFLRKRTPPRRRSTRGSRDSLDSNYSNLVDRFNDKNGTLNMSMSSSRRSVLSDNTEIEEPRRKSWWKNLGDHSRDVVEILESQESNNIHDIVEEYADVEVLSQERDHVSLNFSDSSDSHISSIHIPHRRLFTQKENIPQNQFTTLFDKQDGMTTLQKTFTDLDNTLGSVKPRKLFNRSRKQKTKSIFPTELLYASKSGEHSRHVMTKDDEESDDTLKAAEDSDVDVSSQEQNRESLNSVTSHISSVQVPHRRLFTKKPQDKLTNFFDKEELTRTSSDKSLAVNIQPTKLFNSGRRTKSIFPIEMLDESENDIQKEQGTNEGANEEIASNDARGAKEQSIERSQREIEDQENEDGNARNSDDEYDEMEQLRKHVSTYNEQSRHLLEEDSLKINNTLKDVERVDMEEMSGPGSEPGDHSKQIQEEEQSDGAPDMLEDYEMEDLRLVSDSDNSGDDAEMEEELSEPANKSKEDKDKIEEQQEHDADNELLSEPTNESKEDKDEIEEQQELDATPELDNDADNELLSEPTNESKEDNDEIEEQQELDATPELDNDADNELLSEPTNESKEDNDEIEEQQELDATPELDNDADNELLSEPANKSKEDNDEIEEQQERDATHELLSQEQNRESLNVSSIHVPHRKLFTKKPQDKLTNIFDKAEHTSTSSDKSLAVNIQPTKSMFPTEMFDESQNDVIQKIQGNHSHTENAGGNEEVTSQEQNRESFDAEHSSIHVPHRRLFIKELQNKLTNIFDKEEYTRTSSDKYLAVNIQPTKLFNSGRRTKRLFPSELFDESEHDDIQKEHTENAGANEEVASSPGSESVDHSKDIQEEEQNDDAPDVLEEYEMEDMRLVSDSDEAEGDNQDEAEVDNQDEAEVDNQDESEVDNQDEAEVDNQDESEVDNQDEAEVDNQDESEVDNQDEAEVDNQDEAEVDNQDEAEVDYQDEAEGDYQDEAEGDNQDEAQGENQDNGNGSYKSGHDGEMEEESSGARSEWDSHRTLRKTMRKTFGKDFTPRKSLRTLIMEKEAKRQTAIMTPFNNDTEYEAPAANSTEIHPNVEHTPINRAAKRQTTLEQYLFKLEHTNLQIKQRVREKVNRYMNAPRYTNEEELYMRKQTTSRTDYKKPTNKRPRKNFDLLPIPEDLEDVNYKPPKRYKPRNTSWATKRLYNYLEKKLEAKYYYKARVRAEKIVEALFDFSKTIKKLNIAPTEDIEKLKVLLAKMNVVRTHFEFYNFIREFMPAEIRLKVIPDVLNLLPLPPGGVFVDIRLR